MKLPDLKDISTAKLIIIGVFLVILAETEMATFIGISVLLLSIFYGVSLLVKSNKGNDTKKDDMQTLHTKEEIAQIDTYFKTIFINGVSKFVVTDSIELRLNATMYRSLDDLDVYVDGKRFGSLYDFRIHQGKQYNQLIDVVLGMSSVIKDQTIIDVDVVEKEPLKIENVEVEIEEMKENYNETFIDQLQRLLHQVEDEEVRKQLRETIQDLKELETHQQSFDDDVSSYTKLYEYYLPMLIRILEQFIPLQSAKRDEQYARTVRNVNRSLTSVNLALERMLMESTNEEFVNLSADIQTLDSLLKQDGFKKNEY